MTLRLLIRKLYMEKESYVESATLRTYCKVLGLEYYTAIRYLLANKYLRRILRGIFYRPSIEERKLGILTPNYALALTKALEIKGVRKWYFGLESAIGLNNLVHEHYPIEYVITDSIFRPKPITIFDKKIKFMKVKPVLLGFGIKNYTNRSMPYSDIEKTVLDIIYFARYDGLTDAEIKSRIADLLPHCSKAKLLRYAIYYNKSMKTFVEVLHGTG